MNVSLPALVWTPGLYWMRTQVVNFGIKDSQGREVGAMAEVREQRPYLGQPSTGKLELRIYSQRDGRTYGAIPRATLYDTVDAAREAAEKKLKTSMAKVAKVALENGGVYLTGSQIMKNRRKASNGPSLVRNIDYIDRWGDEG